MNVPGGGNVSAHGPRSGHVLGPSTVSGIEGGRDVEASADTGFYSAEEGNPLERFEGGCDFFFF